MWKGGFFFMRVLGLRWELQRLENLGNGATARDHRCSGTCERCLFCSMTTLFLCDLLRCFETEFHCLVLVGGFLCDVFFSPPCELRGLSRRTG